jgi:hypothetical protein
MCVQHFVYSLGHLLFLFASYRCLETEPDKADDGELPKAIYSLMVLFDVLKLLFVLMFSIFFRAFFAC